jgi:glycosyltransferase involved in cell wall biosynthesis
VARNVGVQQSSNAWVAFIDGDDEWLPNHLQVTDELRSRFPQCVAFGTAYQKIDAEGRVRKLRMPHNVSPDSYGIVERYFEWCVRYDHPIHSSAVVVKRTVLEELGGFPPGVRAGEDLLTWAKLACSGPLGFSSISTVLIHVPAQRSEIRARTIRLPDDPDNVGPALLDLTLRYPHMVGIRAYVGDWHRIRATLYLEDDQVRACASELGKALSISAPTKKDVLLLLGCLVPHVLRVKLIERFRRRPGAFH